VLSTASSSPLVPRPLPRPTRSTPRTMVLLLRLLTILLLWTAVIAVPLNENSAKYPAVAAQAAAIYEQAADRYVTADLYRAAADRWREATAAYETLTAAYSRPAR